MEKILFGLKGRLWIEQDHYLLFSDPRQNTIFSWDDKNGIREFLKPSGYTGYGFYSPEPGSNGLILNKKGELVMTEQGDRRISRMPLNGGGKRTITDNWQGKRFNSPNDICQHSSEAYYFTDPPYGLNKQENDSLRETKEFGVYRIDVDGKTTQIISNLNHPNGICFSPDEKTLYVSQTDADAYIMSYPVDDKGEIGAGKIFFDMRKYNTAADGMKIDTSGNIYTGAGNGIMVISAKGKLLGKIETGVPTSNCAFGEGYLYITAGSYVCRIKVK
ncbi:SMP-30/gluconolactonase/LRE family protein [Flavobacterium sp. 3HN19-14]|uniref:SMP-30/gluconolactonase/LRE family protein n=1 Tax=Flavobacterium sp. 3HN19-14 TaxID=3448133 RepID=UPI003EE28392